MKRRWLVFLLIAPVIAFVAVVELINLELRRENPDYGKPPPDIPGVKSADPHDIYTPGLRRLFPVGSRDADLVDYLRKRGFNVEGREATYNWSDIVCKWSVRVDWSVGPDGGIAEISSFESNICL